MVTTMADRAINGSLKRERGSNTQVLGPMTRIAVLLTCLVLAFFVAASGIAMSAHNVPTAAVLRLAPWNAFAMTRHASALITIDSTAARALASAALKRDPTRAKAVAVLALSYAQKGDLSQARELFAYSQRLSRRDLQSHLWALEFAAQAGNLDDALRHYDLALSTSRQSPVTLFPILATAISDDLVRSRLAVVMSRGQPWVGSFLEYLRANGRDQSLAGILALDLIASNGRVEPELYTGILSNVLEKPDAELTWQMYQRVNPDALRIGIRNGGFEDDRLMPTPLDWNLENRGLAWAEITMAESGRALSVVAEPGGSGQVTWQRLVLPQGQYRLTLKASESGGAPFARVETKLVCVSSGTTIVSLPLERGDNTASFEIAPGGTCSVQALTIALTAGEGGQSRMVLDDIAIVSAATK